MSLPYDAVARVAAAFGGRVSLSALGNGLREIGVTPAALGHGSLTRLLEAMPEVGTVSRGVGQELWFELASDVQSSSEVAARPALSRKLLDAVTRYDGTVTAWYDLAAEATVFGDEPSDPDRFLPLPVFGLEVQHAWARRWVTESIEEGTDREGLLLALEDAELRPFLDRCDALGLRPLWGTFRRAHLTEQVEAWAARHGIRPSTLTEPVPQPRSNPPRPLSRADHLRAFLHRAVDEMTEAELEHVWVPARLHLPR